MVESHIIAENNLNDIKKKVSINMDLDFFKVFKLIDLDDNGYITMNELEKVFEDFGMNLTYDDLQILMERYDKDKDGRISFKEVMNFNNLVYRANLFIIIV